MTRSYPLIFRYQDLVIGNGFICGVKAQGRVLLTEEDQGFWVYGVTPGGLAAGGKERSAALNEFKQGYVSALFDIAEEASDPDAFKREAEAFFYQVCAQNEVEWNAARERVRQGDLDLEAMPRDKGECAVTVRVQSQLDQKRL